MIEPIDLNRIEPGYYRTRLCRGGPWVAVRLYHDSQGRAWALVNGDTYRDPHAGDFPLWPYCAKHRVSEQRYVELRDLAAEHRRHGGPLANPTRPLPKPERPELRRRTDLDNVAVPTFGGPGDE